MPGFFKKLFASTPATARKSKSANDLSYLSQIYVVKEKELPKLHLAAWKGDIDKTIQLCRPDKLNSADKEGRTPIHLAVAGNHLNIVEHLLIEDAKLQILDRDGRSCLIIASIRGNPQIMNTMLNYLEQKSLVNMPDKNGLNPLLYAIKNDNFQVLKVLLKENNINLDHKDKDRNTALHYAVIRKKVEVIDILVEHGADVDSQNADGQTPLMLAAKSGEDELIDVLLDYGADRLVQDKLGITAVKFAEMTGNPKCMDLLKENRPVKPNTSKLTRIKRSVSSDNNLSESEHTGPTTGPTDGTKKFENLFAGKGKTQNKEEEELDTSRIVSEEKSKHLTPQKVTNTWDDDSENDTDSFDEKTDNDNKNNNNNNKNNSYNNNNNNINIYANNNKITNASNNVQNNDNKTDFLFKSLKSSFETNIEDHNDFDIQINEDIFTSNAQWNYDEQNKPSNNIMTKSVSIGSENGIFALTSFLPNKKNQSEANWSIYIHTSNIKGAGTDANVYIQIIGDKGSSDKLNLENKNVQDLFEKGKTDKFEKNLPDIGEPKTIKIGHDNKGTFPGWHLDKVILENNLNGKKYLFNCNRWLAKDELDHKIELDLKAFVEPNRLAKSRDSLTSSWNSSEDEDSLSQGKKGIRALSPKNTNALKQIDEANETLKSKNNSILSQKKAKMLDGINPPEISDFDESFSDDKINKSFPQEPTKGSLAYLIKNNPPPAKTSINIESTGTFSLSNIKNNEKTDNLVNKNENKMSFEFSDEDASQSHSITDLFNQFKSISNKPVEKKPQQPVVSNENESSVEFLIKNNIVPGFTLPESSKNETNVKSTDKNNNETVSELAKIFKSDLENRKKLNSDFQDKSESLDDLEEMFNKAKEETNKKAVVKAKKEDAIESPLKHLVNSNPPLGFSKNESNEEVKKNETISALINNKPAGIQQSSTQPTLSNLLRNEFKNSKPNSIEDNYLKSVSVKNSNDDFDSDSDEIENLARPNKLSRSGTIGTAIGAVVQPLAGSTSSSKSLEQFSNIINNKIANPHGKKSASSFASIIPELFENDDKSSRKWISNDDKLLPNKEESTGLNELINKLRLKNNELERAKLDLESKLRETDLEKKKYEKLFNHSDKELAEKEKLIDKMNEEKLKNDFLNKSDLNDLRHLRKEINELKEDKHALENKLSIFQATAATTSVGANTSFQSNKSNNQSRGSGDQDYYLNESLNIKIKALENQIEELNKDRKVLSACKEDLAIKLEETESDIIKRNEALDLATLKFNLERKVLNDENSKLKKDLNELSESKKKLQQEIDNLKLQLNEKFFNYEKLNLEKTSFESQFSRERADNEKIKNNFETELSLLKEQQQQLTQKLGIAEAKLISTEKDLKYTKLQIDEKEKQINSLKEELFKCKSDYAMQLNLLKVEKEEKENLIKKCESLEASLKRNNEDNNKSTSNGLLNRSYKSEEDRETEIAKIGKENSDLQKEVKNVIDKLKKTEYEFEKFKSETEINALKKINDSAAKKNDSFDYEKTPPTFRKQPSPIVMNSESEKIKNEVQKLRNDFNDILNKYSNLENIVSKGPSALDLETKVKTEYMNRKNHVDVPALITDMPLKSIAKLNNYLIQNIIAQESQESPNIILARGNSLYSMQIPHVNNNQQNHHNHDNQSPSLNCKLCSTTQSSYFDLLKNELSKKIEIEVAKGAPVSSYGYSPNNFNNIHMTRLDNFYDRNTENFDSLYSTLNLNSRYSNYLNTNSTTDLMNSLRSRFLI